MPVNRTLAVSLSGLAGQIIEVEASVSSQLPGMAVIGLPDVSLGEAKQRIRVACHNSDVALSSRFITINLSPAELPKHGSSFDLAMALAALAASEQIPSDRLAAMVHIGELGLDGSIRKTSGILPAVRAAAQAGARMVMVPADGADEARLVPGIDIVAVSNLLEAISWHRGMPVEPALREHRMRRELLEQDSDNQRPPFGHDELDMSDILGHSETVDALAVAAVGGHHTSLVGPPGTGKTMLAARVQTLLPDLSDEEAVEVTSINSIAHARPIHGLVRRPPFENPHHTSSLAAMVGSGARVVIPGAITRASRGVLFLDEAPEFSLSVLDALRQPLESGTITIQRARLHAQLPAKFMLVLASNPCPCGQFGTFRAICKCSGGARLRYGNRISGPLMDRIDIKLEVFHSLADRSSKVLGNASTHSPRRYGNSSAEIRARVTDARLRAQKRLRSTPWKLNSEVSGVWLRHPDNVLPRSVTSVLDRAFEEGRMSLRGFDRALRVAWSIADLDGSDSPSAAHIARAYTLRSGVQL